MNWLEMHWGRHCIGVSDPPIRFPHGAEQGKHSLTNAILASPTAKGIRNGEDVTCSWDPH